MPVYDTPITTDANGLPRIMGAGLPVMLYLYNAPSASLDTAFAEAAEDFAGDVLVVKIDAGENPAIHAEYGNLPLPALVTVDDGEVESQASNIRPEDVDDHIMFLMGQGPLPQETAAERAVASENGAAPIHTTDATFGADVLDSDVPVLVDFWAPWCGPCHMVAPVLDDLAAQYAGQVKIAKLNVDDNMATAQQFCAMSIPMLLMFKGGEQVGKLVGAHPKPNIEQMIRQAL
ncbi:MAG: thioredoxin [Chloroflexota bacterium]